VRDFPFVGFIAHRTGKKFVSFSWKNKIMGMLIPIGEGHEDNPDFTVPITNGLIGSFELDPHGDVKTTVVEHSWKKNPDGFETSGTLLINGGRLKQTLRMISLGSQTVVYEDRVTALSDVTVRSERGVPVGIENDEITGSTRIVSGQEGRLEFNFQQPQQPVALPASWANVDSRMGIVVVAGSGMEYVQASGYSPGISVGADILYGSCSDRVRQFKGSEEVAHRIVIFSLEVTPEETLTLARSWKIESKRGGQVLRFQQAGGKDAEVPLF
jgi:hypothetical protein